MQTKIVGWFVAVQNTSCKDASQMADNLASNSLENAVQVSLAPWGHQAGQYEQQLTCGA